ncbi:MAG: beta-propeller fold lactonase family protein [Aquimonas sp.]|nr:beta-propeller fold lactonase family protein [Aquimonas sp.]
MSAYAARCILSVLALLAFAAAPVRAEIEAPDHVLYGSATLFGQPAATGSVIEVRSAIDQSVLARYTLGRDPRLGGAYRVAIPMSAVNPRIPGSARPGDPVRIFLGPRLAGETSVGAEGVARRLDIDPQNMGSGPAIDVQDQQVFEGNSGTTPMVFTFSMNTTSSSTVHVDYETRNVTANGGAACTQGVDYIIRSGRVSFPPGSLEQTLTIQICGDTVIEGVETFALELLNAVGGVLVRPSAVGTIVDDDDVPMLSMESIRVLEPASGSVEARFTARLSRTSTFETAFSFATQNITANAGSDFIARSGRITIPAGEIEASIAVVVLADAVVEPNETFRLVLSEPLNLAFSNSQAIATIIDPRFAPEVEVEQQVPGGPGGVPGLLQPSALALSPDGAFAYVTSESRDSVLLFARDNTSGQLEYRREYLAVAGSLPGARLDGPRHLVVSADGRHVYVAARNDAAIAVLARDAGNGELSFVANQINGQVNPGAVGGDTRGLGGVTRLALSPDGRHLYASGATADSIAVFARDPEDGRLVFVEAEQQGVNDPADPGGAVVGLERPAGLQFSPDGRQLYVAARFGNAVVVFDRESSDAEAGFGRLSFRAAYRNGLLGVSGLAGAADLVVSGDGRQIYVAAESSNGIVRFDRAADGDLTWRQRWNRGDADLPGLSGPQAIALTPDDGELYVAGFGDSSLSILRRSRGTQDLGSLRPLQTLFDDEGGLELMGGPVAVVISHDNRHVYVVAATDSGVVVLRRLSADRIFENGFEATP